MDIYTYYNIQYPDQRRDLRDFGKSAPFESWDNFCTVVHYTTIQTH